MSFIISRALPIAALLLATLPMARAAEVQTPATPTNVLRSSSHGNPQMVPYAPDGKTRLPPYVLKMHELKDGSFLTMSFWGDIVWYEKPQTAGELNIKRDLFRPEPIKASDDSGLYENSQAGGELKIRRGLFRSEPARPEPPKPPEEWKKLIARSKPKQHRAFVLPEGGTWAISPDEKRVAVSTVFNTNLGMGAIIRFSAPLTTIHVWNLELGQIESEQQLRQPFHIESSREAAAREGKPVSISMPTTPLTPRLRWEDAQTLVVTTKLSE